VHAVLRRALGQAVRAGLVPRNVASREFIDTPRVPVEEPDALSGEEVARFVEVVRSDRHEALFLLALGTGMRQGELLGLAWQDIDLDAGSLRVRYELTRRNGQFERAEPKTDRSRRTVPLAPALVAALVAHRERTIAAGFVPTATGPVFTNRSGGPLNGGWVTHHVHELFIRAGIRRLPFKVLRATFSSRLFEAGVSDIELAQLLGHTRTHTTKRHYLALGDQHASALAAVERLVGSVTDQSRDNRDPSSVVV
jgi:integrase